MAHTVEEYQTPTFSSTAKEDTATRHFQVTLDSDQFGPRTAVQAVMDQFGIRAGSMYIYRSEVSAGCRAKRIGPARGNPGKKTIYFVDVEYSTSEPPEGDDNPENPLDMTTKWGPAGTRTIQKTVWEDADGKLFVNSLGDPLNDGVSIDQHVSWIRARKNVLDVEYDVLAKYTNSWNANRYLGEPKKTVRISSLEYSEKKWQGDAHYFEFSAEFELYPEEQFVEMPNLGWRANFFNDVGDIGGGEVVGDVVSQLIFTNSVSRSADFGFGGGGNVGMGQNLSDNTGDFMSAPTLLNKEGFIEAGLLPGNAEEIGLILKFDVKRTEAFEDLNF